ncbi:hypothetical protein QTN25_010851 [Entamoeba marina]
MPSRQRKTIEVELLSPFVTVPLKRTPISEELEKIRRRHQQTRIRQNPRILESVSEQVHLTVIPEQEQSRGVRRVRPRINNPGPVPVPPNVLPFIENLLIQSNPNIKNNQNVLLPTVGQILSAFNNQLNNYQNNVQPMQLFGSGGEST